MKKWISRAIVLVTVEKGSEVGAGLYIRAENDTWEEGIALDRVTTILESKEVPFAEAAVTPVEGISQGGKPYILPPTSLPVLVDGQVFTMNGTALVVKLEQNVLGPSNYIYRVALGPVVSSIEGLEEAINSRFEERCGAQQPAAAVPAKRRTFAR